MGSDKEANLIYFF